MTKTQFRFRDDAPVDAPVAAFSDCCENSNANAVRIEPGDDVRELLPFLDRLALVEVNFPAFTDGRGFSSARILREAGYTGELRAVGEVLVDHIGHMRRCGFDAFAPDTPLDEGDVKNALSLWPHVYQATVDGRAPIWKLRHEGGGHG